MRFQSHENGNLIQSFNDERVPADEAVRRRLRELAAELTQLQSDKVWTTAIVAFLSPDHSLGQRKLELVRRGVDEIADQISRTRLALAELDAVTTGETVRGTREAAYFLATDYDLQEADQVDRNVSLLPPMLQRFATDKTIPIQHRNMLAYLVDSGVSFKDFITKHFACSEEYAERAETLVVEFLNATQGKSLKALSVPSKLPTNLPDEPPQYRYKPRMQGGIEKYLRDNWAEYIKAGLLSRPDLKRIDKPAYYSLNNYLKGDRKLPSDVNVPDRSEVVDRQIAEVSENEIKRLRKLESAVRRRREPREP